MGLYQAIFFDLDGTIVNSEQGILESVKYSLSSFGIFEENSSFLRQIIGPPLETSFINLFHLTPDQTKQAIALYRERYAEKGVNEFSLYDDIKEVIQILYQAGVQLAVATSKPTHFSKQMLASANLLDFFKIVSGSDPGRDLDKTTVIEHAMKNFEEVACSKILMVGDRKFDILGAHVHGLHSCAVTYGFGSYDELQSAQPTYIIDTPKDLLQILQM